MWKASSTATWSNVCDVKSFNTHLYLLYRVNSEQHVTVGSQSTGPLCEKCWRSALAGCNAVSEPTQILTKYPAKHCILTCVFPIAHDSVLPHRSTQPESTFN